MTVSAGHNCTLVVRKRLLSHLPLKISAHVIFAREEGLYRSDKMLPNVNTIFYNSNEKFFNIRKVLTQTNISPGSELKV